jgi:HD-GYP domain-containing protein (c-di-GMP phosphodiesterase class II)
MVRMSDLVRGVVREPASSAAPAPAAAAPAVASTEPVSLARPDVAEPVVVAEPAPPRRPAEPTEPSEPLFAELQAFIAEARDRVHASDGFPWPRLASLVERAAASLTAASDLFWTASTATAAAGVDYVSLHQARVCVQALRLAVDLGYDRARLVPLGLAAALFDAGLWQMPSHVVEQGDALSGNDLATYRAHPKLSAEIVQRWSPPDARVVDAILDHHEREHGQGFPRALPGSRVEPDAKIIGLVDTYTTLTAPPAGRPALRPHEAIRDIVKSRNDQFPAALIKVLLSEISVFPPGTIVRLNTEEVGRVIAVNRTHPLRPQVQVFADARGRRLPAPKLIDLSEAPFLYITGPVTDPPR